MSCTGLLYCPAKTKGAPNPAILSGGEGIPLRRQRGAGPAPNPRSRPSPQPPRSLELVAGAHGPTAAETTGLDLRVVDQREQEEEEEEGELGLHTRGAESWGSRAPEQGGREGAAAPPAGPHRGRNSTTTSCEQEQQQQQPPSSTSNTEVGKARKERQAAWGEKEGEACGGERGGDRTSEAEESRIGRRIATTSERDGERSPDQTARSGSDREGGGPLLVFSSLCLQFIISLCTEHMVTLRHRTVRRARGHQPAAAHAAYSTYLLPSLDLKFFDLAQRPYVGKFVLARPSSTSSELDLTVRL
nr:unnamed protein product [Digitaria exilis]